MIDPINGDASHKKDDDSNEGLVRWQQLLFPKRALIYHGSTRQHLMSHVDLRRRSAARRPSSNTTHEEEEEKKAELDTTLTDELNESDMDVNELLIAEFKLMNLQMRREIRSLYRLLVIFVLLVLAMAIAGILFCGDFFKNINDFHNALFTPHKLENEEWMNWREEMGITFGNVKGSIDFMTAIYDKWQPIFQKSFDSTQQDQDDIVSVEVPVLLPLHQTINVTQSNIPSQSVSDIRMDLQNCDLCIGQLESNGAGAKNLFDALELIRTRGEADLTLSVQDLFGDEYFKRPLLGLIRSGLKQIGNEFYGAFKDNVIPGSLRGFSMRRQSADSPQPPADNDVIITKIFNAVIEIIRANTKCDTAQGIKQKFQMAINFITDIPLGKIFEEKYIDHIIRAKPVITFPYKRLMCGNTKDIINFWNRLHQRLDKFHFITVDLENARDDTIRIPMSSLEANSHVIIGVSHRIKVIEQMKVELIRNGVGVQNIDDQYLPSLGLTHIAADDIRNGDKIMFTWNGRRDFKIIKCEQGNFRPHIRSHTRYQAFDSHLVMKDIQQLSIDQYSKEFMHLIADPKIIGGVIIKAIQALSIREDVITSPILRKAFKETSDNNPPRDLPEVVKVLEQEFGLAKATDFTDNYDIHPAIKAGSVGQIHRAIPKSANPDQSPRILKVTFYEQVTKLWKEQWELAKMFGESHAIPILHNCWDTISSIDETLFAEMNFDKESQYTKLAFEAIGGDDQTKISTIQDEIQDAMEDMGFDIDESYLPCRVVGIIDKWSSPHVLMQETARGRNLKDWLELDQPSFEQKSKVFRSLIVWWSYLAFKKHIVHSDPHYGNVMVYCDPNDLHREPVEITIIDFGQTDLFLPDDDVTGSIGSKYEWFLTFKKLMQKIYAVYDNDELQFGHDVERLLENLKEQLNEDGGINKLIGKVFLETIDAKSTFTKLFLEDLASVMMELGFESENNSPRLLGGLAMGALNNDVRYTGAKRTAENVQLDPLKKFPSNAALIFRSITGIVGMLEDQQTIENGESLTDGLPLVPMFKPFLY